MSAIRAVISHTGEIALRSSDRMQPTIHYRMADHDRHPEVRNDLLDGNVEWVVDDSAVHVTLDPEFASPVAVRRLMEWLRGKSNARFHVKLQGVDGVNHTIVDNSDKARDIIERALKTPIGLDERQFLRRALSTRELAEAPQWVRDALEYWKISAGQQHPVNCIPDLRRIFSGRFFVLETTADNGHVLKHTGDGLGVFISRWSSQHLGQPILSMPDKTYANGVERNFQEASAIGLPVVEIVDAFATWPTFGRVRHCYIRVCLPYTDGKRKWLVSGTHLDPKLSLRRR